MSTSLKKLESRIRSRFPDAIVSIDAPSTSKGTWWLDASRRDSKIHVAWRRSKGFGISSDDAAAFGEGHDEVYSTVSDAWARVQELLGSGTRTNPGIAGALRNLREEQHVPQSVLATRMDIQQAAVSKLERRQDMLLSTLRSFVTNLGGELELTVRFPSRTVPLLPRASSKARSRLGSHRKTIAKSSSSGSK